MDNRAGQSLKLSGLWIIGRAHRSNLRIMDYWLGSSSAGSRIFRFSNPRWELTPGAARSLYTASAVGTRGRSRLGVGVCGGREFLFAKYLY